MTTRGASRTEAKPPRGASGLFTYRIVWRSRDGEDELNQLVVAHSRAQACRAAWDSMRKAVGAAVDGWRFVRVL